MAEPHKGPVTLEVLLVSGPSQTDAPAKLLIEKVLITRDKFMEKLAEERATYQKLSVRRRNEHQSFASKRIDNTNYATD
jgi:hypothetical protein